MKETDEKDNPLIRELPPPVKRPMLIQGQGYVICNGNFYMARDRSKDQGEYDTFSYGLSIRKG